MQSENNEHDGKLQEIISKMKKNAQQAQNVQKLQSELKKEIIKKPLGKSEAELKIHNKIIIIDKRSLFMIPHDSKLRYALLYLTEWNDREDQSIRNKIVDISGRIFTVFFTIESVFKILSYGFIVHKSAYLRDSWNWLDFIVVIIGWIELLPDIPNLRGLRTLRVLRPLRSINAIPSMKSQITSLLKSLGQLVNVLLFLMFLFIIFGILGVQLYQGQFYQRCRLTPTPDEFGNWPIDTTIQRLCAYNNSDGWYQCPEGRYCGSPKDYDLSLDNENLTSAEFMNYGITTFDNLGIGMLTIFQSITLEGWSELMYMLMDSGAPWLAAVYFTFLVFLGETKNQQKKDQQAKKDADEATKKSFPSIKSNEQLEVKDIETTKAKKQSLDIETSQNLLRQDDDADNSLIQKHLLVQSTNNPRTPSKQIIDKEPQNFQLPKIESSPRNKVNIYDLDDLSDGQDTKRELIKEFHSQNGKEQYISQNNLVIDQEKVEGNISKQPQVHESQKILQVLKEQSIEDEFKSLESQIDRKPNTPFLLRFKNFLLKVALSSYFSGIIMTFIVLNTLTLAMDQYPGDPQQQAVLDQINVVLTWCFFGEMIIKISAFGPKLYAKDRVNLFDAVIVIFTIGENLVTIALDDSSGVSTGGAISGLRAIRLFRIFKLARNLKSFQVMLNKITMSLKDIANFSVLLFLFLFTFTLMGLELFSNKVKFDKYGNLDLVNGISPRANFDYFLSGFTTIFIVLIGDGWNSIMYQYWTSVGSYTAFFFILLQVFGKYVLLNLFLAILLENFEDIEDHDSKDGSDGDKSILDSEKKKTSMFKNLKGKLTSLIKKKQGNTAVKPDIISRQNTLGFEASPSLRGYEANDSVKSRIDKHSNSYLRDNESEMDNYRGDINGIKLGTLDGQSPGLKKRSVLNNGSSFGRMNSLSIQKQRSLNKNSTIDRQAITQSKFYPQPTQNMSNVSGIADNNMISVYQTENQFVDDEGYNTNRELVPRNMHKSNQSINPNKKKKNLMEDLIAPKEITRIAAKSKLKGRSLYILGPNNKFRLLLLKISSHKYFDPFILFLILFSTLTMTVDNPLNDPKGQLSRVLTYIDIVVTTLFTAEMLIKILVYGLIFNGETSYLRNSWNIMDFFIVIFSIISIIFSDLNIQFIKVIRMLRVLRPLRMISRNEGLKLAVESLINAIPSIINALVIALLFFILFGIFGTNYFKGKFYYCITDKISDLVDESQIVSKWDCINMGGDWINKIINFDNLLKSMMSLYILSSTEGWADIMFDGVDATQIDYNPITNSSEGWVFFFMAFMVIGSMFTLNLFVSIVVNTYYSEKEKLSQNHVLTKFQKQWIQVQMICLEEQPNKPKHTNSNKIQRFFRKFAAEDSPFDMFILGCIIVNTLLMTLDWYNVPESLQSGLDYVNYIFTAIFTLEAIFKIIGYGKQYFTQGWNIFDFAIVCISYVTLIIGQASTAQVGPKQATIARAFRIGRIFRLIKKAKFLRIIFNTIILTIPSLANVGALLILLLYIFSILGVQFFATIKLQDNLNIHGNFQTFGLAFLTLVRLQTGENWNAMMEDTLRGKAVNFDCDNESDYESIQLAGGQPNGCGGPVGYLYFIMFTLIVSIIFLNLFVAVILQGFTSSNEEEALENQRKLNEEFKNQWEVFDPQATGFINVSDLGPLIDNLEEQSKLICEVIKKDFKRRRTFISQLQIPTYHKFTKYKFEDVLSCLSKKYTARQYVLDKLSQVEADDMSQVDFHTKEFERQFDEEMENIKEKGSIQKIQLFEQSLRISMKYSKKMIGKVDQFEGKYYDSSYVVWVPILQEKIKPMMARLFERRQQNQRINQLMEQNNLTLIMETGGQLNEQKNMVSDNSPRSTNLMGHNMNHRASNSSQAHSPAGFGQNGRRGGQTTTTGEVGGTFFNENEGESIDHEYDRVIDEELKEDRQESTYR